MPITELNLTPGRMEQDWVLNVLVSEASGGVVLKPAILDYRYGIKSITISTVEDEKQITLLNGETPLIGPIELGKYNPITLLFESAVYCTAGNALILKTEDDFDVYLLIQGKTCPPIPAKPFTPSPQDNSASVGTPVTLTWESENQSVDFHIYIGTISDNLDLAATQNEKIYVFNANPSTTYYWRIDERFDGNTATGNIWSFTTA